MTGHSNPELKIKINTPMLVGFHDGYFYCKRIDKGKRVRKYPLRGSLIHQYSGKIIGNIHQNGELLK